MKLQRLALLGTLVAAAACEKDAGPFYPETRPSAFVRYVNAVADTATIEFKFVDKVEGSAYYGFTNFRQMTNYKRVDAGERHVKVFNAINSGVGVNDPAYVTIAHVDTTLTFNQDTYYTVVHVGQANGGNSYLRVIEDPRPAVPGGQIGVRVIHAGAGMGDVDIYAASATGATLDGTSLFTGVGFEDATNYVNRATGTLVFEAADAGVATQIAEATAPAGALAASSSQSNQAGYSIAGSLLTAFVFPPSTRTGATVATSIVWMQDNRP